MSAKAEVGLVGRHDSLPDLPGRQKRSGRLEDVLLESSHRSIMKPESWGTSVTNRAIQESTKESYEAMKKSRLQAIVDVHVIFENDAGEWLLSERSNTGYKDGEYSLVAGHLEDGESVTECAARESMEEAGVIVAESALELRHVMRRDADQCRISFFFLCKEWSGKIENMEPNKCGGLSWHAPSKLPEPIVDYVAQALAAVNRRELVGDFTPITV